MTFKWIQGILKYSSLSKGKPEVTHTYDKTIRKTDIHTKTKSQPLNCQGGETNKICNKRGDNSQQNCMIKCHKEMKSCMDIIAELLCNVIIFFVLCCLFKFRNHDVYIPQRRHHQYLLCRPTTPTSRGYMPHFDIWVSGVRKRGGGHYNSHQEQIYI